MTWLLSNLKITLVFLAILIGVCGANYIYTTILKGNQARELQSQKQQMIVQCKQAQQITKEANDALQIDRNRINNELANYKQLHPNTCIIPDSITTNVSTNRTGRSKVHGISSDWLRGFAAVCESYRSDLVVCEEWGQQVTEEMSQ